jgi:hypothetical protein
MILEVVQLRSHVFVHLQVPVHLLLEGALSYRGRGRTYLLLWGGPRKLKIGFMLGWQVHPGVQVY